MHDERYATTRRLVTEKPACFDISIDGIMTLLKTPDSDQKIAEGGLRLQGFFKERSENKPLITVVTVVYNGAKFLEDTIKSVVEQTYDNVEYIIVDGGSKDGTLDIVRRYEHAIDYWVSEPDKGIYDAMNKGIKCGNGDLVSILNADDYYYHADVLRSASQDFDEKLFLAGNAVFQTTFGSKEFCVDGTRNPAKNIPYIHTATMIPMYIHRIVGLYDTNYKIAADIELFFRIKSFGFSYININSKVVLMRDGGASHQQFHLGRKEFRDIYLKYNPNKIASAYFYYFYSLVEFFSYNNTVIRYLFRLFKGARGRNC